MKTPAPALLFLLPFLYPGREAPCTLPEESPDVFPSQEREAVLGPPPPEQVEETWQGHGRYQGGGPSRCPRLAEGVWRAEGRPIALGTNTQEPSSACQWEDGQKEEGGVLGSPGSLATSPVPGSQDHDLIPNPTSWCC